MHSRWTWLFFLWFVCCGPVAASVESDFKAARGHAQKGQLQQFDRLAKRIPKDHLLQPYLQYWRLVADNATADELQAFIQANPDSPLADRLRIELAKLYALAENWPAFRAQYRQLSQPPQELTCHELYLRLQEGDPRAAQSGIALWHSGKDMPSSCNPLFARLFELGRLGPEDRYQRLRLALDNDNLGIARAMDAQLPPEERMQANALAMAQRHGDDLIRQASPRRAQREAALYALSLFARLDPEGAAQLWEKESGRYSEGEQRYGWGQIALYAARQHDARALDWFARAAPFDMPVFSELQAQWRARAAIRFGRWQELYNSIQAMPAEMQEETVWRYWKARALKAMNAVFPANLLFARLSQETDYYGLLALEELPPRVETRPAPYRVTPEDLQWARSQPGLQRALLLNRMDLSQEAVEEWNRALQGASDRQLLAAAELALREEWHDRAILTANRTRTEHNFDLRYIAPYRDLASAYAQKNGLDEAWVYGLIRQESHFVTRARSRSGAQGLMQIMPATAKWIGQKLGLDRHAHTRMDSPEANLHFGTFYLRHAYDTLDQSAVLATAGYNAGPGRARRWQADTPLEGAVYVETIPFTETRIYVKKVMANAMFYRSRFGGDALALKDRLGTIPARRAEAAPGKK